MNIRPLFFKALLLGLVLLLIGCGHTSPVIRTVAVLPPDNLLQDCSVAAPPNREAYKAAGESASREEAAAKREKMLIDHAGEQLKNIQTCNLDKGGLRSWKKQQQEIYKTPPSIKRE